MDPKERREQAAFESTTKGIGKKLLMKMGWKEGEGLGKEGEGIVKPIEVTLRPKGTGLGFSDEPDSRKAHEALFKSTPVADDINVLTPHDRPWKKSSRQKKTEMREEVTVLGSADASVGIGRIIDMRSGEARELGSLAEMTLASPDYHYHDPLSHADGQYPELVQAVRRLAMQATREEQAAQLARNQAAQKLEQIEVELRAAHEMIVHTEAELQRKRRLESLVKQGKIQVAALRHAYQNDDENGDELSEAWSALFNVLRRLSEANREAPSLETVQLALALLAEPVRLAITNWNPFGEADILFSLFSEHVSTLAFITSDGSRIDMAYQLMHRYWLPPVRILLVNQFDPRDTRHMDFVTRWYPLLKGEVKRGLIGTILRPKLEAAFESAALDDTWIATWIPVIESEDELAAIIRRRLSRLIERIPGIDNPELKEALQFWGNHLPKREADLLIGRGLLPRLTSHLNRNLTINPAEQDIEPILAVLGWSDVLPTDLLADTLKTGLFPKLRRALHSWMSDPGADLCEVADWYEAWKGLLPAQLSDHPVIQQELGYMLAMMEALMEDHTLPLSRFV